MSDLEFWAEQLYEAWRAEVLRRGGAAAMWEQAEERTRGMFRAIAARALELHEFYRGGSHG